MSDAHAHARPDQPETTHALLWVVGLVAIIAVLVWWFAAWMWAGSVAGRKHGPIPLPQAAAGEPDHRVLIARRDQAVLDEGSLLFAKNCASCHGPNGDANPSNMNPPPRNLRKDAWKNAKGGGPYALYLVLTHGYGGGMPGFPAQTPAQRYALVHFMRETQVKAGNPSHYVEKDSDAVLATIPPPGPASGPKISPMAENENAAEGPRPEQFAAKDQILPLMTGVAKHDADEKMTLRQWIIAARQDASGELLGKITLLGELVERQPGLGRALRATVREEKSERFAALLAHGEGTAEVRPVFSLATSEQLSALFAHLRRLEKP